jgi:hypothetical protein
MDASNSEEMLNRFRRNDILVDSDNEDDINKPMEISP